MFTKCPNLDRKENISYLSEIGQKGLTTKQGTPKGVNSHICMCRYPLDKGGSESAPLFQKGPTYTCGAEKKERRKNVQEKEL